MSAEELQSEDRNGYWEKEGVLLSKVGVFPYLGAQIAGAPDPTQVYLVYRPEEELSDPECVDSFKLLPWIDDHEMLGPKEEGKTPAEEKGVHGVIGEQVCFEKGGISEDNPDGGLRGNIKLFSESLKAEIENGKEALSCGYTSRYDWTGGEWNGQRYDVIQRRVRGNHLALVEKGRMGPEVSVFDHLDIEEFVKMDDDKKTEDQEITLESLAEALKAIAERLDRLEGQKSAVADTEGAACEGNDNAGAAPGEGQDNGGAAGEGEPGAKTEGEGTDNAGTEGETKTDGEGKDEGTGMDAALKRLEKRLAKVEGGQGYKSVLAQAAERDRLAGQLTPLVGTFDHALMTPEEVAAYGCKKLGITCAKGHERAALAGYLAAAGRHTPSTFTFDSATSSQPGQALQKYLKGE